jgi:hypothetical protein
MDQLIKLALLVGNIENVDEFIHDLSDDKSLIRNSKAQKTPKIELLISSMECFTV